MSLFLATLMHNFSSFSHYPYKVKNFPLSVSLKRNILLMNVHNLDFNNIYTLSKALKKNTFKGAQKFILYGCQQQPFYAVYHT